MRAVGSRVLIGWCTVLAASCGDSGGNGAPIQAVTAGTDTTQPGEDIPETPGPGADISVEDTFVPEEDTEVPTGRNVLMYDTTGFDGQACKDSCALKLEVGQSTEIAVRYVDEAGKGLPGVGVRWQTDAEASLKLGSKTSYTDDNGRAALPVDAIAAAASAIVTASLADQPDGPDLPFAFAIAGGAVMAAEVTVDYEGTQNVTAFHVRLYRAADGAATCEIVHPDSTTNGPTATVAADATLGTKTKFAKLDGLAEGATETWLAQVVGPKAIPIAAGCVAFEATFGVTAEVTVSVTDLPLLFGGVFSITSVFDMYTGLGGTAGTAVELVVELFASPGATALKAACAGSPSFPLSTVCGFMVDGNGNPDGVGETVAAAADKAFYALIAQFLGENVAFTGDSIASLLEEMRFGSKLEFTLEPSVPFDGELAFPDGSIVETWETASYLWKFGKNCPVDDEDCGFEAIKLADVFGASPTAGPSASVTSTNGLNIAVHSVDGFDYGQLVNFLIENRVLPSLFGDGKTAIEDPDNQCDGDITPIADTYGKVISMIFGDECCLLFNDCCEWFAQKEGVNGYPSSITIPACELLIDAADSLLRKGVQGAGGNLQVGTAATCPALEVQGNRSVDALGSKAAPCSWDATVEFVGGGEFEPENTWTGVK